ncbi:MAG TPA: hydantoinase B/oxoprolinase family protein, partial [Sulfolobales archaeon]|nr:hydantoinase B/oxoprolinase family protein [Sulfolobales archaeon]
MRDIFTLEIINNALISIAEEMFYVFGRTAKSPVIYEVLDYAVALMDEQGNMLAQANGVPGFVGVLDYAVKGSIRELGEELEDGDIIIVNIPHIAGTHLNDVVLIKPIFYKEELVGFSVNKGHWSEIGGMRFGSWTTDSTEIFQEGLQIPPVKLYKKGKPVRDIIEMIRQNSRLPEQTLGDMMAQIAALMIGSRRVTEIIDKYGITAYREACKKAIADSYRYAIIRLKELPKGTFMAHDYIDDDGITDEPLPIKVSVRITDEDITVDFTGSSKQAKGPINSPLPGTIGAVRIVYVALLDPHHPYVNYGFLSPLKVHAPEGTVFNPSRDAPVATFWESMLYATDLVWKALAPHVPNRLPAGHFLTVGATILGGRDKRSGEPFGIVEPQPGGWGAASSRDGVNALVCVGDGETYASSIEVLERRYPVLVEQYSLNIEGGAGHGKFRGGFGIIKDYRVLTDEAFFTISFGRSKYPPWGVSGGLNGTPCKFIIRKNDGRILEGRKIAAFRLSEGDVVSIRTGGGGGWGDPLERDPELVLMDVINEYITI